MKFGFITGLGLLLAILAPIAVVAAAVMTGGAIFSAGPLNSIASDAPIGGVYSHSELACRNCHVPFWGEEYMGDRCLACHTNVADEMDDPASLHGALAVPSNCHSCHTDHQGQEATLTRYDADLYPHAEFGFYLIAHLKTADGDPFACRDCHTETLLSFDVGRCGACHLELDREFTESHLVEFDTGCLNCHDGIDSYGSQFDHQATEFALTGKHLNVDCAGCHQGARELVQLKQTPQDCIGCHLEDDLHQGSLGEDCAACHTMDGWGVAEFDHALTGFPLVEKHGVLDCVDCHLDRPWDEVPRDCVGCHAQDDIHQGRLGTDCVACHNAADWSQVLAENFDHSLTRYPLTGKHATLATCEACHIGGQLKGTPTQCVACHSQDDAHRGNFGLECASCHNTSSWQDADFDHNLTGFRLDGAHAGVTCVSCHPGGNTGSTSSACISCHQANDAHAGAFGTDCSACHSLRSWKPATFNHSGQTNCSTCHINVRPANHPSGQCSQCHNTSGWKPANFNHTGLADCASCHANVKPANHPSGQCSQCHSTSAWRPVNFDHTGQTNCQNCHSSDAPSNHYAGQCSICHGSTTGWANNISFSHAGQTNCQSCHSEDKPSNHYAGQCSTCHGSTTSWASSINFSHAGQTDCQSCHSADKPSNHYAGQCSACHGSTTNWASSISFSHTGQTDCQSCHSGDKPSNHYAGQCSACHGSTTNWASSISFSHTRQTDCQSCHSGDKPSNHYAGQCSACHGSTTSWASSINFSHTGQTDCQSCHRGDKPSPHYSGQCSACHSSSSWRPANSYSHSSSNFPSGHRSNVTCIDCHGSKTNAVSWSASQYAPDCAGCHANDWRSGPHNGATVSELRNCGGACHQSDPEHRASNGEW